MGAGAKPAVANPEGKLSARWTGPNPLDRSGSGSYTEFWKEETSKMVRSIGVIAHQSWFLPAVLVVISAIGSWEFACITPFVAFAVVAGYALSPRTALL